MANISDEVIQVDLTSMKQAHDHLKAALHLFQHHLPHDIMPLMAVSMQVITAEATLRVLIASLTPQGPTN